MKLPRIFKKRDLRKDYDDLLRDSQYNKLKLEDAKEFFQHHRRKKDHFSNFSKAFMLASLATGLEDKKRDYASSKKRLNNLYEKSYSEATKLNKKHHDLINKYGKESKKVYEFEMDKLGANQEKGLARKVVMSLFVVIGISMGFFFLLPTLTGNTVANLTTKTSGIIGMSLFVLLMVGLYLGFKKRN